jgi:hypothetical protein
MTRLSRAGGADSGRSPRWAILQQNCGYRSSPICLDGFAIWKTSTLVFAGCSCFQVRAIVRPFFFRAPAVPAAPLLRFAPVGAPCAGLDESPAALGLRLGRYEQRMSDWAVGSVPAQL